MRGIANPIDHALPNGSEWNKCDPESQDNSGLDRLRMFPNEVVGEPMRRGMQLATAKADSAFEDEVFAEGVIDEEGGNAVGGEGDGCHHAEMMD